MEYKQAIIVRMDLKMSKGKLAAQVAHASVDAALKVLKENEKSFKAWKRGGMKKVVLRVNSLKEMIAIKHKAERSGLKTALIQDAGLTELKPGTKTVLGVGPASEKDINKICEKLKTL